MFLYCRVLDIHSQGLRVHPEWTRVKLTKILSISFIYKKINFFFQMSILMNQMQTPITWKKKQLNSLSKKKSQSQTRLYERKGFFLSTFEKVGVLGNFIRFILYIEKKRGVLLYSFCIDEMLFLYSFQSNIVINKINTRKLSELFHHIVNRKNS